MAGIRLTAPGCKLPPKSSSGAFVSPRISGEGCVLLESMDVTPRQVTRVIVSTRRPAACRHLCLTMPAAAEEAMAPPPPAQAARLRCPRCHCLDCMQSLTAKQSAGFRSICRRRGDNTPTPLCKQIHDVGSGQERRGGKAFFKEISAESTAPPSHRSSQGSRAGVGQSRGGGKRAHFQETLAA